jgi:hypothetical protein
MSLPVVALLALALASPAPAQALDDAIKALLAKVAQSVEPGPGVRVSAKNISSLANADLARVQRAFERALARRQARRAPAPASLTEVKLTLAEDVREFVLIAEIVQPDQRRVELVRFQPPSSERQSLPPLERRLLWEQPEPILDALPVDERLLILEPQRLAVYDRRDGQWTRADSASIDAPPARDPRGRLALDGAALTAHLPGVTCHGRLAPALALDCTNQTEDWPLAAEPVHFVVGRNTLESGLWSGFYALARLEAGNRAQWLLAAGDGRTRLYDANRQPIGWVEGLNGDWVGVCGDKVLLARPTEKGAAASLAAYAIVERKAVPATAALDLPAPVTALWPAPGGAIAIARNAATGNYAAYSIHLDCSR